MLVVLKDFKVISHPENGWKWHSGWWILFFGLPQLSGDSQNLPYQEIGHDHSWAFGHMCWDKLPHSDLEGREQEWVASLRFRNLSLFKHVPADVQIDTEHVRNKISKLGPAPAIWSHQSRGPLKVYLADHKTTTTKPWHQRTIDHISKPKDEDSHHWCCFWCHLRFGESWW